jgi:hypothetical protein
MWDDDYVAHKPAKIWRRTAEASSVEDLLSDPTGTYVKRCQAHHPTRADRRGDIVRVGRSQMQLAG